MIDTFTANASLPIRIARGIGHDTGAPVEADGNIFAGGSDKAVVAGPAAVGSLKLRLQVVLFSWTFSGLFAALTNKCRRHGEQNEREHRIAAQLSHLPALVQSSVKPIPQQVEHNLFGPSGSIRNRNAQSKIRADMLPLTDGHLHLRQDVPICFGTVS